MQYTMLFSVVVMMVVGVNYLLRSWVQSLDIAIFISLYYIIILNEYTQTVLGQSEFSLRTPSGDSPRVLAVLGLSSD